MRKLASALALGALLVLAGCGGVDSAAPPPVSPATSATASASATPLPATKPSPGPRPTLAQLSSAIQRSQDTLTGTTYTAKQAACIARVLLAADLSDGALNALAADIGSYVPGGAETAVVKAAIPKIVTCSKG